MKLFENKKVKLTVFALTIAICLSLILLSINEDLEASRNLMILQVLCFSLLSYAQHKQKKYYAILFSISMVLIAGFQLILH